MLQSKMSSSRMMVLFVDFMLFSISFPYYILIRGIRLMPDGTRGRIQYANDTDMAMGKFTAAQCRTMLAEFWNRFSDFSW